MRPIVIAKLLVLTLCGIYLAFGVILSTADSKSTRSDVAAGRRLQQQEIVESN